MSAYRNLIDQTTHTIERRARYYRNLVVAVTFVCFLSGIGAWITWSWRPLTAVYLLVSFCGLYFFSDNRLLSRWRHELFTAWIKADIELRAFNGAVSSISILPGKTVQSMLATLPTAEDVIKEQGISQSTRAAIAAVATVVYACRSDRMAFKSAGYTLVGAGVICASVFWMWQPLLCGLAISPLYYPQKRIMKRRLNGAKEKLRAAQKQSDFSSKDFLSIIGKIQWEPVPGSEKKKILSILSN